MRCRTERAAAPGRAAPPGGAIGLLAARSLFAELACCPKPGLVSFRDRGSNRDMDAALFLRSIVALRPFFSALARAGYRGEPFDALRRIGVEAEEAMLGATGGINTHRGAIFSLGLLAAAAGRVSATGGGPAASLLPRAILDVWGDGIAAHEPPAGSHGARVCARFGVPGALGEAARGFPALFGAGLPALEGALDRGCDFNRAMTQAYFRILAALDDTNLLHRAGREGLVFARECARRFLEAGGVFAPGWKIRAGDIHRRFIERDLSPGGAGDMLACAAFVHLIAGPPIASPTMEFLAAEDTVITEVHGGRSLPKMRLLPMCGVRRRAWASR